MGFTRLKCLGAQAPPPGELLTTSVLYICNRVK